MKNIVITVESNRGVRKVLAILQRAEEEGEIEFGFNVEIIKED